MKAKLLRILRRDAEKRISLKHDKYDGKSVGTFFIMDCKEIVYVKFFKSEYMYMKLKEEAFEKMNKLRRAYILDKLQKLK